MTAVAKGEIQMVQLILKNKSVEINVKDPESGVNSFWLACLYGRGSIMKLLAEQGIDIYVTNQNKINVLHLAVLKNHIEIVKMLLKSNFPLDQETDEGMTAFHLAAQLSHTEVADIILSHLLEDSQYKQSYVLDIISKVNSKTNLSPLSLAILIGNKEIAKKLIISGARSFYFDNSQQKDLSPIFLACEKEQSDLLELMCDHGASLSVQNTSGQTPLMFASQ